MSLNIVITMAGCGTRFRKSGYKLPKYEILAHGRSLFDWSLFSLKNFLFADVKVIFVCLRENNSAAYVRQRCQAWGIRDFHIIELSAVTDGQATSAYAARECWIPHDPLLIYNIDTYVNPRCLSLSNIREGSDGWVPCFQAVGEHWSFVKIDEKGWVIDLAEKKCISNYATIGLYWFSRAEYYERIYLDFFSDESNLVKGERYIAPLYRQMISENGKVSTSFLSLDDVHVLGTPEELNSFVALNPEVVF
ncbi:MAG: glycosyltransferase family 2 protein [Bdellovibrionales bacterium]|nr:glycosyltransferase family 2 protein [Bdellovibrionales bacterium]